MNRYENIPKTKIEGKLVYQTSRYPEIPLSENDIYVYTTQGDRFDTLSQQFYKDSSLWWIIAVANNINGVNIGLEAGLQLRIPKNKFDIINQY